MAAVAARMRRFLKGKTMAGGIRKLRKLIRTQMKLKQLRFRKSLKFRRSVPNPSLAEIQARKRCYATLPEMKDCIRQQMVEHDMHSSLNADYEIGYWKSWGTL